LADEITPSQQLTEIYNNHDKVAYISINREIGFIPVRLAQTPEYESYESYLGQWRQLEQLELNMDRTEREIAALAASIDNEKTAYDGKLGGRVSLAEPEYSQMGAWLARINASVERYNGLIDSYNAQVERYNEMITGLGGGQYDPMAIVSRVEIYW